MHRVIQPGPKRNASPTAKYVGRQNATILTRIRGSEPLPLYFNHCHTKLNAALRFSSFHIGSFGLGSSRWPRLLPGTTTLGGGLWICIEAFRRHLSGFQPSDFTWYAAISAKKATILHLLSALQYLHGFGLLTPMYEAMKSGTLNGDTNARQLLNRMSRMLNDNP